MEEIKIKDYGLFNDAISNINGMTEALTHDMDSIVQAVNTLDESVFMGPIKDNFSAMFNTLYSEIHTSLHDFNSIETGLLGEFSQSYQSSDSVVSNKVGSA